MTGAPRLVASSDPTLRSRCAGSAVGTPRASRTPRGGRRRCGLKARWRETRGWVGGWVGGRVGGSDARRAIRAGVRGSWEMMCIVCPFSLAMTSNYSTKMQKKRMRCFWASKHLPLQKNRSFHGRFRHPSPPKRRSTSSATGTLARGKRRRTSRTFVASAPPRRFVRSEPGKTALGVRAFGRRRSDVLRSGFWMHLLSEQCIPFPVTVDDDGFRKGIVTVIEK